MPTTASVIHKFLQDLPRSKRTKATYAEGLKLFQAVVGNHAVLDAESYKKFLLDTKDLNPSTQRTYAAAVRILLIRSQDVTPSLLYRYTKDYGLRQGKRYPRFDQESIETLIKYAQGLRQDILALRDRAMILTLVGTGLRIHVLCGLTRGDIDWKKKRAVIIGKGDKQAVVRFTDQAISAIQDYLHARAKQDGQTGIPLETLPLFGRHDKGSGKHVKPLSTKGAWAAFKDRLVDAGIDRGAVRVHDARHYFVTTTLRESGGDLKLTQELARHESIEMTARYAHITNDELDDKFNAIHNSIGGKK